MKKILKDLNTLAVIALCVVWVIYSYLQARLEVSWLPTEARMPLTYTVIGLCIYFSIIANTAARFNTRGGIYVAIAGIFLLIYSQRTELAVPDEWNELLFAVVSGFIIAFIIGRYVQARNELRIEHDSLKDAVEKLQNALSEVKTLSGLIPICASCKKIKNDKGYYETVEKYIEEHSSAEFSHGLCKECLAKLYPGLDLKSGA